MNRRTFLQSAFCLAAGAASAPIGMAVQKEAAKQATVDAFYNARAQKQTIKRQTRLHRQLYGAQKPQMAYFADMGIYLLAAQFNLPMAVFADVPYLVFSDAEAAREFAARYSLQAIANGVYPDRRLG